jgi:hypothetical protein
MARIQTETGARNVQSETHKGRAVEVVTGFDIQSDKYPIHIYIDGQKIAGSWRADSMSEAFDEGFRVAAAEIDQAAQ